MGESLLERALLLRQEGPNVQTYKVALWLRADAGRVRVRKLSAQSGTWTASRPWVPESWIVVVGYAEMVASPHPEHRRLGRLAERALRHCQPLAPIELRADFAAWRQGRKAHGRAAS